MSDKIEYPTLDEIAEMINPKTKEILISACECINSPGKENLDKFRNLCDPGLLLFLIRVYANGVVEKRVRPLSDDFDVFELKMNKNMITLKTLPEATAQEVFNQVVRHLRKQNRKSTKSSGDCAYRGENGLVCAAGCLISDNEYKPEMDQPQEGGVTSWYTLMTRKLVPRPHEKLITALQDVHDGYEPSEWERRLEIVAEDFNLEMPD